MSPSRRRPAAATSQPKPPAKAPAKRDADRTPVDESAEVDDDSSTADLLALGEPIDTGPYSRLGAGAGVAYALCAFVGSSLMAIRVDPEDPALVIANELAEERGRVSAGILLTLFSVFFLVVFVSWLHRWLRGAEGPRGWLATLELSGGVLLAGMLLVVTLLSVAGTVLDNYGADEVVARTLLVLQWQALAIAFVPAAAFVGGTSVVGFQSGRLPRWLSYIGFAIAIGLLIPPVAFFPFLLSSLWTGMLAVILLSQLRAERRSSA